ncbi:hypothetical protein D0U02_28735 [Burkholderia pseudomallei]|uniref:Uncharacterized protein n=1 Tax=Burkholderia pseudomallei TaxID=28450 RepID=A0AAX0U031_BURPE|nr:hypothetical protein CXQ84_27560 [Burkholderia pseudomallei]AYX04346.1 hypothetical protein EGY14_11395 [Burkholderia pseudomallei]AYX38222.1 hypothetical protein EGY15_24485 [Burkholderia pseudomallei]KAA8763616.1 hypothetical protein F5D26_29855 [Burkholderia pseudomallei]MBM5591402.1 hypothetical protein [Burkholderia pseudomallei]
MSHGRGPFVARSRRRRSRDFPPERRIGEPRSARAGRAGAPLRRGGRASRATQASRRPTDRADAFTVRLQICI